MKRIKVEATTVHCKTINQENLMLSRKQLIINQKLFLEMEQVNQKHGEEIV